MYECNISYLQAIVPLKQRRKVLHFCHDTETSGHLGVRKTLSKIRQHFYWPDMQIDVRRYIAGCEICWKLKHPIKKKQAPMQLVKTGVTMQRNATDILGELPETENVNKYILVVSDYFTKWTEAFPMPNMEAQTVAKIIVEEVVTRFGVPHYIHSDQGRQYENNHRDWDKKLPYVMMAYRSTEHETTGMSPNMLMLGRETVTSLDLIYCMPPAIKPTPSNIWVWGLRERLEDAHALVRKHSDGASVRQKTYHDRRTSWERFETDDKVDCGRNNQSQIVHCDRSRKKVAQLMRGEDSCDAREAHETDIIEVENVEEIEELNKMPLTKVAARKTKEISLVTPCVLCQKEFGSEDLKNHLLLCVKEKSEIRCEDCGTIFKKQEYLKRHMKNIHGVETAKRSSKVIEKKVGVSERAQDDLDQYDPGNLIDDISDDSSSADLDTPDDSDSDVQDSERKACHSGEGTDGSVKAKVEKEYSEEDISRKKEDKKIDHTPEDKKSDPTVRKMCAPLPVLAPTKRKSQAFIRGDNVEKEACGEMTHHKTQKFVTKEQATQTNVAKERKMVKIIKKYVENGHQIEKVEEHKKLISVY
ncbi:unnamed protein product [Mytilus coruscus]|uniref:Integrase catalytic domain-containing protein n=1 Tax=Mytilus coruscus TaxID=42192 RepID=A0A6J8AIA5_MYTCO|nr:unnamed protein product [Mytilus coruscus]